MSKKKKLVSKQTIHERFYKLQQSYKVEEVWEDDMLTSEVFRIVSSNYSSEDALKLSYKRNVLYENNHKTFHKENENFDSKKFARKYNTQLRLSKLTKMFNDNVIQKRYSLPTKLIDKITEIIQIKYFNYFTSKDKRKYNVYKKRLEQALYICIAVSNFNQFKKTEKQINDKLSDKKINLLFDTKYRM